MKTLILEFSNNLKISRPYKILVFVLLVFVLAAGSAGANEARISIGSVDTSQYPRTSFTVSLTGGEEVQERVLTKEHFTLHENGKYISDIEVKAISQEPEPLAVVLLLDVSGSMVGKPLEDAKAAARLFIEQMRPRDQVAIVTFDSEPRVVSGLTGDKNRLSLALDGLQGKGETALYDAILDSLDILSRTDLTHRNLIVLSDGRDTMSTNSLEFVQNRIKIADIPVLGVGLESPEFDSAALQSICENSGGTLLLTPESSALSALYARLAKELHNQYRLTYVSKQPIAKELKLELGMNAFGTRVNTTTVISNPKAQVKKEARVAEQESIPEHAPWYVSSSYILFVVILLSFLAVFLLVWVILSIFFPSHNAFREQMKFYDAAWKKPRNQNAEESDGFTEKSWDEQVKDKLLKVVGYVARQRGFTELVQLKLEQAGLPLRPLEFISLHFLFTLLLGVAASTFTNGIGLVMIAGLAAALPIIVLYVLINQRKASFYKQLPDTLSMIAGSIRAGYSFSQAISAAVEETLPPMSVEFKRVLAEARLGLSLEEALERMAQRVGEQNFSWTVMAINIQREVGGNLAEVLEILADTIRERDRVRRQIDILTAEGRLSAAILIALPFVQAFLLFILNPSYMSLLVTTSAGLTMVGMALFLILLGGLWLKKIVTIEV